MTIADGKPGSLVRFSIAEMCLFIAAVAVVCGEPASAFLVLPFLAILLTRHANRMKPGWQALIVAATYFPSLIGFQLECGHCREFWIRFGGVVPGGIVWAGIRTLFRSLPMDSSVAFVVAGVSTLMILVGGMLIARRGICSALVTAIVILVASSVAYGFAYAMIRM